MFFMLFCFFSIHSCVWFLFILFLFLLYYFCEIWKIHGFILTGYQAHLLDNVEFVH